MDFKEQTRNFEGLFISKILWFNQELSLQEKMFLVEISSLDNKKHCHASNKYFSSFFQLSANRCSEIISNLKKHGLIEVSYVRENKEIKERIIRVLEKGNMVLGKPVEGTRKIETEYSENSEERNNSSRSNSNRNKRSVLDFVNELDNISLNPLDTNKSEITLVTFSLSGCVL